jgi:hypothetical protein
MPGCANFQGIWCSIRRDIRLPRSPKHSTADSDQLHAQTCFRCLGPLFGSHPSAAMGLGPNGAQALLGRHAKLASRQVGALTPQVYWGFTESRPIARTDKTSSRKRRTPSCRPGITRSMTTARACVAVCMDSARSQPPPHDPWMANMRLLIPWRVVHTACLPRHLASIVGSCLSLNRPSRAKPCVDDYQCT